MATATLENKLKELVELSKLDASQGGSAWTGQVTMDNLDPELKRLLKEGGGGAITIKLPDYGGIETETSDAQTIPAYLKIIDDVLVGNNVFLVGEAGTGKTYLAKSIAKGLQRKTTTLNSTQWTSPREIMGGETIEGYKEGKLVEAWENGWVLIIDELPKLDPNTAGLLNEALALTDKEGLDSEIVTGEGRRVQKHPNFACIATGNTTGKRTSSKYAGNNRQDASLIDRFAGSYYWVEFNRKLEMALTFSVVFDILDKIRTVLIEEESGDIITLRTMLNMNRIYTLEMEREIGKVPQVKGGKTLKDSIESYLQLLDEDVQEVVKEKVDLKNFYSTYKNRAKYLKEKKEKSKKK